jgi:CHAT domain-containing protein
MAPIADKFVGDNLIIIPDGPLWHLNFELLLTQKDDSNNPALLSYLLKEYAVTYANSANLLFNTFKSDLETKPLQECLAFSFSDSTQTVDTYTMSLATLRSTGNDLPGTRKEIKAISDIIDGQYYFGSQAIEANFKSNASKYNILHLALHGEVDNERPENSKLYFTKSKDTIEDNLLYSHELFALDIPAELTVLSACNTGSGKIAKGEGIMSLGTAFQYAGTKSLLLTSWEVSDQTTPELMKYFYTNLKAGMNKGKALQQAKLHYLTTANINRADPFYWGGFYLVGDAAPMHFNDHTQLYWILGLGAVGIMLLVVFLFRRRIKNVKL